MIKTDKVIAELKAFWDEIVVENRPRYKDPREWAHLYVDLFVSFFSMSYLLGHVMAVALPTAIICAAA